MVGLPDGEKFLRICVTVYTQYRRVTYRRTDRQISCHGIVRAMHTRRAITTHPSTASVLVTIGPLLWGFFVAIKGLRSLLLCDCMCQWRRLNVPPAITLLDKHNVYCVLAARSWYTSCVSDCCLFRDSAPSMSSCPFDSSLNHCVVCGRQLNLSLPSAVSVNSDVVKAKILRPRLQPSRPKPGPSRVQGQAYSQNRTP